MGDEWVATPRVGIGLGVAFTVIGALLAWGSWRQGDLPTATHIALPAVLLGLIGTPLYASLPRRRVAVRDDAIFVDGVRLTNPTVGTLTLRGEGFTSTRAFALHDGPQQWWIIARHFPMLDAMHAALVSATPVVALGESPDEGASV